MMDGIALGFILMLAISALAEWLIEKIDPELDDIEGGSNDHSSEQEA